MSKKKKADHIHKYRKMDIGAYGKPPYLVFKCMKPACTHYVPINLAIGLVVECNRCHEPFVINKETLKLTTLHCLGCTKRKKVSDDNVESVTEYLRKLGL